SAALEETDRAAAERDRRRWGRNDSPDPLPVLPVRRIEPGVIHGAIVTHREHVEAAGPPARDRRRRREVAIAEPFPVMPRSAVEPAVIDGHVAATSDDVDASVAP